MALTAVYIKPNKPGYFIVYSDVCEDGIVKGQFSKVLGTFYKSSSLAQPIYLNLNRETIPRIKFKVQTIQQEESIEEIFLTLHFQRKE